MVFTYLGNVRSTDAPNALKIIGKNARLPLKCILVWGKAEQDNKYRGSRRSQELQMYFTESEGRKGEAFVTELKLAKIIFVFVESAIS